MITICPERDDGHAPFAHRLVIPMMTVCKRGEVTTTLSPFVFVICAHCDHWIERVVGKCRCRMHCHRETGSLSRYHLVT